MGRRRSSNKRADQQFKLFLLLSLLIAGVISLLTIGFNGGKFNPTAFLITFFVSLIVCVTISLILSSPKVKGKIGEKRVAKKLEKLAKKYGGYVINDVTIPDEETGKTSQIDHIYISKYGVFVVETKNYAGRIYGNDSQREWTQVLAYGHSKNKLYNPVKQNQTHIFRLKKLLNINHNFVSVVVFVAADTRFIESEYVYSLSGLRHLVDKDSPIVLNDLDVEQIFNTIKEYKDNPVISNKQHVKEVKQMKKDIANNICPRCGGNLILRVSKTNGSSFYGCENYPKCTFTKKK